MNHPVIKINVRNYGTMTAELYPEFAPKTVANFLNLIEKKFFDGKIFHRIIKGFMIQGGGYSEGFYAGNVDEKGAEPIRGEFAANGFVQNTLKHTRGVLSMARTSDPDSATSQFFVMHKDAPHLDAQYAGFGKVTDGLDVLDSIASVKTGRLGWFGDVPREPVVIESITLSEE
ncbi:MAG: peptidylprolyl isomerase [Clostridia bacterium]|nr:peptidylprolyl isomerase [Clostridia bacterium]